MKVLLNWKYYKGVYDTKTIELVDLSARKVKNEVNAEIAIKDGMNFTIAEMDFGDLESSNAFAKELVRRWNEFPEELKQ
jgi:hypothetical protein